MIQNLHNKTRKICTTKYSKFAQQITQNLHNELLKICTTKHSKFGQQNTQSLANAKILKKSIDFFLLLTIIEYERSKKVKDKMQNTK